MARSVPGVMPEPLFLGAGLHRLNLLFRPFGQTKIIQGDRADRENCASSTIFRAHISKGGAIGQWNGNHTRTVKTDTPAQHAETFDHGRVVLSGLSGYAWRSATPLTLPGPFAASRVKITRERYSRLIW